MNICIHKNNIENAVLKVSDELERMHQTIIFKNDYLEQDLFVELASCILGSHTLFETAKAATDRLNQLGLLNIFKIVKEPEKTMRRISEELKKPIYPSVKGNKNVKYIYPNSKAHFIVQTAISLYVENNESLVSMLDGTQDEFQIRAKLSDLCMGIGYKQASLFLRNIKFSNNIAVLDSHVLNYMLLMGIDSNEVRKSLSQKQYILYEKKILTYANNLNQPMSRLDFAIWIVMRVMRREFV